MRRFGLSLALLSVLLALPIGLHAQTDSEVITSFDTHIALSEDSAANITETITYDFGRNQKHGILRYIPLRTKVADSNKHYFYDLDLLEVRQDGAPVKVQQSRTNDWQVLKIGDPDSTIKGEHVYTIRYQMDPVILKDPEGDYLSWNLTGNDWQVPLEKVTALVELPTDKINQVRCYSGPTGSTEQKCNIRQSAHSIFVSSKDTVNPGEGMTLNVLTPDGTFSIYQQPRWFGRYDLWPIVGIAVGISMLLLGLLIRLFTWLRFRYRLKQQIIVPQYEAPGGLSPGEIGLLNDNRADMQEITATLVDLAVRGFIKIEQTRAKSLFRKPQYTFHLLKDYQGVTNFEKTLLDMIFENGKIKAKKLKDISKTEAPTAISSAKSQLKSRLNNRGDYIVSDFPTAGRRGWRRLVTLLVFLGIIASLYALLQNAHPGLVTWSIISLVVGSITGWLLTKRREFSRKGFKDWAAVEGLKLYLSVAEKDRLKFHNAPAKSPQLFSKLLPYAIALGVERAWAKQFAGMDVAESTDWYSGRGSFNAAILSSSLSSDFSRAVATQSTPVSSGSSSGGGFSGGGGGGGGGGSW